MLHTERNSVINLVKLKYHSRNLHKVNSNGNVHHILFGCSLDWVWDSYKQKSRTFTQSQMMLRSVTYVHSGHLLFEHCQCFEIVFLSFPVIFYFPTGNFLLPYCKFSKKCMYHSNETCCFVKIVNITWTNIIYIHDTWKKIVQQKSALNDKFVMWFAYFEKALTKSTSVFVFSLSLSLFNSILLRLISKIPY